MIDGMDITNSLFETMRQANDANDNIIPSGIEMASANAEHDAELAKSIVRLKAEGVPATIVEKVAKGEPSVTAAKYRAETNKVVFEASKQEVSLRQTELKVLNDMANREYGRQR